MRSFEGGNLMHFKILSGVYKSFQEGIHTLPEELI